MTKHNKTYANILRTDRQTIQDIKNRLITIGVDKKLIKSNKYRELLIEIPKTGLGLSLNQIKKAVSPACVRLFDCYTSDIGTEERIYYND